MITLASLPTALAMPKVESSCVGVGRDLVQKVTAENREPGFFKKLFTKKKPPDWNVYFSERERLMKLDDLPAYSAEWPSETRIAWQETLRERTNLARPAASHASLDDFIHLGSEEDLQKLSKWANRYAYSKRPSERSISRAAFDLESLLHRSTLSFSEWKALGLDGSTQRFIEQEYAALTLQEALNQKLGSSNLIRPEKWNEKIAAFYEKPAVKSTAAVALNASTIYGGTLTDVLFVWLPKSRIRLTPTEISDLLKDGLEAHADALFKKYRPKVARKVFYNSLRKTVNTAGEIALVGTAAKAITNSFCYKELKKIYLAEHGGKVGQAPIQAMKVILDREHLGPCQYTMASDIDDAITDEKEFLEKKKKEDEKLLKESDKLFR